MLKNFKDNLIEHETVKGFFRHPTHLHIFVSRSGLVYNDELGYVVPQSSSKGYFKACGRPVHLWVCETFLNVPEHLKGGRIVGNHENGITSDNNLSNLEWTSYSGNSIHAYRTGLRSDNVPVLIKDLRSGEIIRYYSQEQAGLVFNVGGGTIQWFLKPENIGKIFHKFFLVIREGTKWPDVGQDAIDPVGPGRDRKVYVADYKLNVRIVFPSLVQAGEHLGIKMHTLYARLRKLHSKGMVGYVVKDFGLWYLDAYLEEMPFDTQYMPELAKPPYGKRGPRKQVALIVTDLTTGKKETVLNSEVFARRLGVRKNTFQRYIYFHNGIWKNLYHVRYVNDNDPTE